MRTKNPGQPENAFVKQIFDKETGKSMKCRMRDGEEVQQMYSVGWWDRETIPYDQVMSQVVEALRMEQRTARCVRDQLDSKTAVREKEKRMAQLTEEARVMFTEMSQIETPELQFYQKMEQGEITEEEYQACKAEILGQLSEKEKDFSSIVDRMAEIQKAYSAKNPWIKVYANLEVPDTLTKAQVRKWIGRVTVEQLTTVEICLPDEYLWWKDQLPVQLLEVS